MLRRHELLNFPGSLHFLTTVTAVRGHWFLNEADCRPVLEIFEACRQHYGLDCLGYVLMPDHLHTVLYQQDQGASVMLFMRRFKSLTSMRCRPAGYPRGAFWRRHYDDVPLPGIQAVLTRITYMHENPSRGGFVEIPEDYLWSSIRDYLGISNGIVLIAKDLLGRAGADDRLGRE